MLFCQEIPCLKNLEKENLRTEENLVDSVLAGGVVKPILYDFV